MKHLLIILFPFIVFGRPINYTYDITIAIPADKGLISIDTTANYGWSDSWTLESGCADGCPMELTYEVDFLLESLSTITKQSVTVDSEKICFKNINMDTSRLFLEFQYTSNDTTIKVEWAKNSNFFVYYRNTTDWCNDIRNFSRIQGNCHIIAKVDNSIRLDTMIVFPDKKTAKSVIIRPTRPKTTLKLRIISQRKIPKRDLRTIESDFANQIASRSSVQECILIGPTTKSILRSSNARLEYLQ